jgi:hypothetical protein
MASETDKRGSCRLALTINWVHFPARPIKTEDADAKRSVLLA